MRYTITLLFAITCVCRIVCITCPAAYLSADLTGDGIVNVKDISMVAFQWLSGGYSNNCPAADITGDCFVDLADLALISKQWLTTDPNYCPKTDLTGDCYVDIADFAQLASEWLSAPEPELIAGEFLQFVTGTDNGYLSWTATGKNGEYSISFYNIIIDNASISDDRVIGNSISIADMKITDIEVLSNKIYATLTPKPSNNSQLSIADDSDNQLLSALFARTSTVECELKGRSLCAFWSLDKDLNNVNGSGEYSQVIENFINPSYYLDLYLYSSSATGLYNLLKDNADGSASGTINGYISAYTNYADCPVNDLTGDCAVDTDDITEMGSEWLTGQRPDQKGIEWVFINNDRGIDGHEGFDGFMSKYEITNAQYCRFLNNALNTEDITVRNNCVYGSNGQNSALDYVGCMYYRLDGEGLTYNGAVNGAASRINYQGDAFTVDHGFENHPVTYVSWYGAKAFCNYYGYKLPTEWQWRAAADYDGSYLYGCGTYISDSTANIYNSTHPDGTTPAGAYEGNCTHGYGLCDMAGNVFEWTDSAYATEYRILLGGCWDFDGYGWNISAGVNYGPCSAYYYVGFRVVR